MDIENTEYLKNTRPKKYDPGEKTINDQKNLKNFFFPYRHLKILCSEGMEVTKKWSSEFPTKILAQTLYISIITKKA